jgi:hypothetical protein
MGSQWVFFEEFLRMPLSAVCEISCIECPLRVLLLVYLGMEMKRVDRGELSNALKMRADLRDRWKELL